MIPWVVNLRDAAAGAAALTGGKAARLSRLARAGMTVPDAFIITTAAFDAHFHNLDPQRPPPQPDPQPALADAITEALRTTFPDRPYLVVRSSAHAEDGGNASFAGQHDTYYYIGQDNVVRSVIACWMSLWSKPAMSYRARQSAETGSARPDLGMAVIVQRMIQADRAGVCFTADPTGRYARHAWIEATWGLGAALVDGRVSPDRLRLERDGTVVHRQIGRKQHKVVASLSDPSDTRLEPVPAFQQTRSVLNDGEAADILRQSLEAEGLFGGPQDVEWAYHGETLFLLQSRPVTGASDPGAAADAPPAPAGRWVLFKPLAENFTDPLTPMTADLFRRVMPPVGRFVDGHYYLNLDLAERLCPLRWNTAELVDAMLLRGQPPPLTPNWWKLPASALALALCYLLDGISWHRTARLRRASLLPFATLCQRLADSSRHDVPDTLQRLVLGAGHAFEPIGRRGFYVNVSAARYFLLLGVLRRFLLRHAPDLDPQVVQSLCSGDGDTFSRQMVEAVRDLATVAGRDPALTDQLTGSNATGLGNLLTGLAPEHPFAQALEGFLVRFGHRCSKEMELATPRWREDPLPVLLMVRGFLNSTPGQAPDQHAAQLIARDQVHQALPRRWQRRLADYLIGRVRYYVSLREDSRHYHAMAMDVTRSKLLDLERRLLAAGHLRVPGDLFFLTWAEADGLAAGRLSWQDVSETLRQRRRRRQQRLTARTGVPQTIGLDEPAATLGAATDTNTDTDTDTDNRTTLNLRGQCASPGTAEGRVRIVLDPAMAQDIEPGDILVAPFTDPGWTPLFPLVDAVVVEIGSFLSHAGTVAREYGIPCLVDVADCTRALREGQRIRVLASEGRIEVCEP